MGKKSGGGGGGGGGGGSTGDTLTCAVSTSDVQLESLVTDTAEHAKHVLALPLHTQVGEHVAFIDV